MKIRPSIQLYFLLAMLGSGIGSVSVMTITSLNHFSSGMDLAMAEFLRAQATSIPLGELQQAVEINELTIASRWQDLPQLVRDTLDESQLTPNQLFKESRGLSLFSSPSVDFFVMKVKTQDKVRFITLLVKPDGQGSVQPESELPPFLFLVVAGVLTVAFFAVVMLLIHKKITTPIEALGEWAKGLDNKQSNEAIPNFHYQELNALAEIIQSSFQAAQESLLREERFLAYASHELRTPISVVRINSELLRKMVDKGVDVEKQLDVLSRLERASCAMTDLTETLLWLNRDEDKPLPLKRTLFGELIRQVESDLQYLLQDKSVQVEIKTDNCEIAIPEGLCRIVMTNLIRNAFQHTDNGEVLIEQHQSHFIISNHSHESQSASDELGFGLGLELTERLIAKCGWRYSISGRANTWRVEVWIER
ncbi:HAMP domain-containing histidine kinase [Vibrio sp. JPW-9-11-11]|uniref:sensor histidine kinase n=1 Tax=Vibrio sp. JPW-9-11-11 TaxID=1416532 RepID=UPI00159467FB|nr:HAMP domain-containing sensor histidine kinase [Vibrio sp. JPW-9-11-11]NVD09030.1 HAMP domain-containing histidine kinase [Vibrio sp. JPW-9-11-11]